MNGKKLAAKIMLGLLLATPYSYVEAAVVGDSNNSSEENINITGAYDVGINRNIGGSSNYSGEEIIIDTTAEGNVGVWADYTYNTSDRAVINLGNSDKTNVISVNVVDNYAAESPKVAIGLWASGKTDDENIQGGQINVNGNLLKITGYSESGYVYGIYAQNKTTTASPDKLAEINIDTDNTYINVSTGENALGEGNAIVAMSQGIVNINSNLEVYGDNAIVARGDSSVNINVDKEGVNNTTKLYGDINFAYDEETSGTKVDADVNINLNGENSVWEGNTVMEWELKEDGDTTYKDIEDKLSVDGCNITLSNGAQWNATQITTTGTEGKVGSAYVALNNLTLNDGIINLDKMKGQALEIENLDGAGGTVNTNSLSNKMSIGTVADSTSITVNGSGEIADAILGGNATAQDLADVVTTGTDDSEKSAASQITTDEGIIAGKITADVNADGKITNTVYAKNTTNLGLSNLAAINLMTWRQENNDMNKRLGELRDSKGEHGVWARMVRGEVEYESIQNQYNYYQIGYDEKLSTDPNWTVGMFLTRTEGNSTFRTGSAENNHTGVGVYGSYLKDDGSFIDLVAKYARIDSDFNANGGVGSGDYNTNGYSISAEYGKRFEQGNGFWIEPQVELTYGTVGAVDYTTSNGAKVRQEGMDSLVGRVGFSLGKDIKAGNIYARASYLYDFDGETEVTMSHSGISDVYEQDLGGGWFEVGLGANINLSDATHLYFDVEKTYGGDVATPWQWSAGIRYSF